MVEVSEDGASWIRIGDVTFDMPTNGFTDLTDPYASLPGDELSDFQQPFTEPLASFDGLPYVDVSEIDILDVLAGSGGGTWIDISGTGFAARRLHPFQPGRRRR